MATRGPGFVLANKVLNTAFRPLFRLIGGRGGTTVVTYVGRRSGKTFHVPVGYKKTPEGGAIEVAWPDRKTWWRNFTGEGGPMTVLVDGSERSGHAVVTRQDSKRVSLAVTFD